MAAPRVIPVLLLVNQGLVKTREFKNPIYVGDPVNTVKLFNDKEVDEIIMVDILASRKKSEPDYHYLEQISSECFMPLTYGGGVHTLDQIRMLIKCGVEKIMINSCLLTEPLFLKQAVDTFGSSSIVAAMDVRRNILGSYRVYDHVRKKNTSHEPEAYAALLERYGAGELFINSVNLDGTMKGYDIELIRTVTQHVSIPVIGCGGCSSVADISKIIRQGGAQAAAAGSFFVFHGPHRAVLISYLSKTEMKEIETVLTD